MYSFASKIYKSVIGNFEEQISEDENPKDQTTSSEQTSVKVSVMNETSNNHIEFAVPAPVPKMQVSNYNGTTLDDVPEFLSSDSPQRAKKRTPLEKANKLRQKIALEPGCSPLDWANLTSSGANLRGVSEIRKYTINEVNHHKTKEDAWTVFNGKIYNITPYIKFHPGGEKELMRSAVSTHSWINYEFMLEKCFVGFLSGEQRNLLI
ncbi:5458_t:CDS:2 [Funneliformis geosporum]|uniref:6311_t:CDS:1 n=1 Tax=Funneliformis geosporum TaxID=1117311 RepID=A0A9W4WJ50_9GLOM|nr:5458_t:CDS:2 [Funneliformis geosporum]CAI2165684.1 6311_t:CDS:2 [Funneliformis geosporum]